jgi:hypothetical protein
MMEIVYNEFSPVWDRILAAGLNPDPNRVVITYGSRLFAPMVRYIPEDLLRHEETHSAQQGANPDGWWDRYLTDPFFRIQQEAEAYGAQYKFVCEKVKDRNRRYQFLMAISIQLAGPMYGSVITRSAAEKMIKSKA